MTFKVGQQSRILVTVEGRFQQDLVVLDRQAFDRRAVFGKTRRGLVRRTIGLVDNPHQGLEGPCASGTLSQHDGGVGYAIAVQVAEGDGIEQADIQGVDPISSME